MPFICHYTKGVSVMEDWVVVALSKTLNLTLEIVRKGVVAQSTCNLVFSHVILSHTCEMKNYIYIKKNNFLTCGHRD